MKMLKVMAALALVGYGSSMLANWSLDRTIRKADNHKMHELLGVNVDATDQEILDSLRQITQNYNRMQNILRDLDLSANASHLSQHQLLSHRQRIQHAQEKLTGFFHQLSTKASTRVEDDEEFNAMLYDYLRNAR